MAAIPAPEQQADSARAVLAAVREARAAADREEVRILELALDWAAIHGPGDIESLGFERGVLIAGEDTPEVGEFCAAEFAAALNLSTESGRSLIADAVELAHRLPRVWARARAGKLAPWRARRIATSTIFLPPEGAEYVDRHVTIYTDQTDFNGTAHVDADLDLADALDLDAALANGAARLAELGCEDSLDARRAHALGELARGTDPTLPLPGREVVLNVHVSDDAFTEDGTRLARVESTRGFVSVDQVRTWCGTPGTTITVRPVRDLNEHLSGTAYETPDRLVEQSALVDETCVFPWCNRPARRTDCDHVIPHADGGTTCSCNIARLCRRHHRLKTHTAWAYVVLERGSYLWTSPHGYQFLRDRDGTLDVTPSDARHRSAERTHVHLVPDP